MAWQYQVLLSTAFISCIQYFFFFFFKLLLQTSCYYISVEALIFVQLHVKFKYKCQYTLAYSPIYLKHSNAKFILFVVRARRIISNGIDSEASESTHAWIWGFGSVWNWFPATENRMVTWWHWICLIYIYIYNLVKKVVIVAFNDISLLYMIIDWNSFTACAVKRLCAYKSVLHIIDQLIHNKSILAAFSNLWFFSVSSCGPVTVILFLTS